MNREMERYSRQVLFSGIKESGQEKLSQSKVLIVGMGALGTAIANHLVRAGVGLVRLVDRDYVELSNLQRQMLYDEQDVADHLPKAEAAKVKLRKMNSSVEVEASVADVNANNIMGFIRDIDVVVDGTDNFKTRFLLNDACFKLGIPFAYGGVVGSTGLTGMFVPGRTACLSCLIGAGGSTGDTCDTVGVISPIVDIVASLQCTETLKWLTGNKERLNESLTSLDIWNNRQHQISILKPKPTCPTCQQQEYPHLNRSEDETSMLCGRETVQINHATPMNLEEWHTRLKPVVREVKKTPFLIRAQLHEGEKLVLFPDGRVLVQGTEEINRAKSLFSRYIGD
ncbi:ThiF family adenylyltransferase [Alkalicoccobacillus porphyridii]|uniref:Thiazole biosynthesis adenylyltransferase ThiF n=1 Tax=Alkalicoccobacillus porphyridii TaxID=2597270 RepID=A0A553ZZ50_9BACI|nr:ThiF family adenylyltransferase [Alkalicoccobacillus porphyridii]TSB46714.1 thiazole biosynthesis adenylyltransferase ThiF [Alkalicoccobacillus porphyridii]